MPLRKPKEPKKPVRDKDRPALNKNFPHLKIKERMFANDAELKEKIEAYFLELKNNKKEVMSASGQIKEIADPLIPTVEGLSAYLGFKTVKSLWNYTNDPAYSEFHDTLEAARAKILGQKMTGLVNGKGSASGLMFDLVNNHGYKNKSEVEVESNGKMETKIVVTYE
jgi:uncharacterized protein (UPF0254 family)